MNDLKKIFNGADELLDRVVILSTGSHGAGSYSLPAGYSWTDFESVEFGSTKVASSTQLRGAITIPKETIEANPTSFVAFSFHGVASGDKYATMVATSANTFDLSGSDFYVKYMIGYVKKYGTRNLSKIVNVNNGSNIAIDSRYEIDIASELGSDYLNRDLIVEVEVYNSDSAGEIGWGVIRGWFQNTSGDEIGLITSVLGSKIIVQSARNYLTTTDGSIGGHPFAVLGSSPTSMPCRVKVWKVDEYLPTTPNNSGVTTLWSGSASGGTTIDWSGTGDILSDFDVILLKGYWENGGTTRFGTVLVRPADLLLTSSSLRCQVTGYTSGGTADSESTTYVYNVTETSAYVFTSTDGSYTAGLTGIYGIKYN